MEFYIRPITNGDGKGINELRRMPGVFENNLGIPSERVKRNEDMITNLDANQHMFVAVSRLQTAKKSGISQTSLYIFRILCTCINSFLLTKN